MIFDSNDEYEQNLMNIKNRFMSLLAMVVDTYRTALTKPAKQIEKRLKTEEIQEREQRRALRELDDIEKQIGPT